MLIFFQTEIIDDVLCIFKENIFAVCKLRLCRFKLFLLILCKLLFCQIFALKDKFCDTLRDYIPVQRDLGKRLQDTALFDIDTFCTVIFVGVKIIWECRRMTTGSIFLFQKIYKVLPVVPLFCILINAEFAACESASPSEYIINLVLRDKFLNLD